MSEVCFACELLSKKKIGTYTGRSTNPKSFIIQCIIRESKVCYSNFISLLVLKLREKMDFRPSAKHA